MGTSLIPAAEGEKGEAEKTEALNFRVERKPLWDSRVPARRAF